MLRDVRCGAVARSHASTGWVVERVDASRLANMSSHTDASREYVPRPRRTHAAHQRLCPCAAPAGARTRICRRRRRRELLACARRPSRTQCPGSQTEPWRDPQPFGSSARAAAAGSEAAAENIGVDDAAAQHLEPPRPGRTHPRSSTGLHGPRSGNPASRHRVCRSRSPSNVLIKPSSDRLQVLGDDAVSGDASGGPFACDPVVTRRPSCACGGGLAHAELGGVNGKRRARSSSRRRRRGAHGGRPPPCAQAAPAACADACVRARARRCGSAGSSPETEAGTCLLGGDVQIVEALRRRHDGVARRRRTS